MKAPSSPWFVHHIRDVIGSPDALTLAKLPTTAGTHVACWVRAIGNPPPWSRWVRARVLAAWWVLTGRAIALQWPRDGELEFSLYGKLSEPLRPAVRPLEDDAA